MLASDARRSRHPGHHFSITGIEHKGHTDGLTNPTRHLIRTPAQVRAEHANYAVVRPLPPGAGMAGQHEAVLPHDVVGFEQI